MKNFISRLEFKKKYVVARMAVWSDCREESAVYYME